MHHREVGSRVGCQVGDSATGEEAVNESTMVQGDAPGSGDASTTGSGIMVAMFHGRAAAEAAIHDLRELGMADEQIGVALLDPVTHELTDAQDIVGHDELAGATRGFFLGAPIGSLAGIALSLLVVGGVGTLGLGGILALAGVGAFWGIVLGAEAGLIARVRHDEEEIRWSEIPLGPDDVLVAVSAGTRSAEVRDTISRGGTWVQAV
jgi:hypothetical protein